MPNRFLLEPATHGKRVFFSLFFQKTLGIHLTTPVKMKIKLTKKKIAREYVYREWRRCLSPNFTKFKTQGKVRYMKEIRNVMANLAIVLSFACAPSTAQAFEELVNFDASNEAIAKHHSSSSSSCERGPRGERGKTGKTGETGKTGKKGETGKRGHTGPRGHHGNTGGSGTPGVAGPAGPTGPSGPEGITPNFSDFYETVTEAAVTVAAGSAVPFDTDGPSNGVILRNGLASFTLPNVGTYQIEFQVSVTEAAQLQLRLNGNALAYTVVGRATGSSQIVGLCLVTTTTINEVLEVINPAGNTDLNMTPDAGGTHPVTAHLVITQIQ